VPATDGGKVVGLTMKPDDLATMWAADALTQVSPKILKPAALRPEDESFLAHTGLPRQTWLPADDPFLLFPGEGAKPDDPAAGNMAMLDRYPGTPYRVVGYIGFRPFFGICSYFGLKPADGSVWMMDENHPKGLLVNSGLLELSWSLFEYRKFREGTFPDERKQARTLRRQLANVDRRAFRDRNSYWPVMMADLMAMI